MAEKDTATDSVGGSTQNNPLSRKLNKILETRLENDKEMLEALKSLSVFFKDNSLRSRRNLRSDIERRSLAINQEFVENFKTVKEQLDSVYEDVKAMNDCCNDMVSRLKASKAQTHDLINQTTQLQTENQRLAMRAKVVDAFLGKYQLQSEEMNALRGARDGTLHPGFFKALIRVRQIHSDCKVLLRTHQQTAGLEIMEAMALYQESAYERLYRWTQNECRALSGDSPDISTQLCEAVAALQKRPVLFGYSVDEFGTARRTAIVRTFIDALTRGGPGGTPRPIELHSHDPLRYVGDMLAWLHQGTASEKEHLQALLRQCNPTGLEEQIINVLDHITEGLCRPLKVRVEQVLVSEPGSVTLYKLSNLLKFYNGTISQIIKPDGSLLQTIWEVQNLSRTMFFNSLSHLAAKLLEKVEIPPPGLGTPSTLQTSLQLLQDILSSHDSSVVPVDSKQDDFHQILQRMVEPLVQMCAVSASNLGTVEMATYMVNCLYHIHTTLALYEYTDHRLEMLQAQIDAHIDTLVSEQASYILSKSGLANIYATVQQHQPQQGSLADAAGMDTITVKSAMSQFDSYLASPDSLEIPQSSLIMSRKVRDAMKTRSVELIYHAYKQLYAAITSKTSGYKDVQGIVPRTPDQVAKLLSM